MGQDKWVEIEEVPGLEFDETFNPPVVRWRGEAVDEEYLTYNGITDTGKLIKHFKNRAEVEEDPLWPRFMKQFDKMKDGPGIVIELPPMLAWQLIVQLQLSLQVGDNFGPSAQMIRDLLTQLADKIAPSGAMREVYMRGMEEVERHA